MTATILPFSNHQLAGANKPESISEPKTNTKQIKLTNPWRRVMAAIAFLRGAAMYRGPKHARRNRVASRTKQPETSDAHEETTDIVPVSTQTETTITKLPAIVAQQPNERAQTAIKEKPRRRNYTAYLAAITLATVAAALSIKGMIVLFHGDPLLVVAMAIAMEATKLVTAGWLAGNWRATPFVLRWMLVLFVLGIASINAMGVFAQLVSAHMGERAAATAANEVKEADVAGRIELASATVSDIDRRLYQIDNTIDEAAKHGKVNGAMELMKTQKQQRASLVVERQTAAETLSKLKGERATLSAKSRQAETEAAPIRYVAELIGVQSDSERAIRWLIALMVLCCDPLAIALTAAVSSRRD
jgi:hypothetical protein